MKRSIEHITCGMDKKGAKPHRHSNKRSKVKNVQRHCGVQKYNVACIKVLPNVQYYFNECFIQSIQYFNNIDVYFDSIVIMNFLCISEPNK